VIFTDRDEQAARDSLLHCVAPERALSAAMDISHEDEVSEVLTRAVSTGWDLDIVVANAGIQLLGQDRRIDDLELEVWRHTLDVNLTGTFLTVKHAVRAMRPRGTGSIIVTGSPTGLRGSGRGFTAYSASKAGVHGMVRVAANDCAADGIRVNCVVPGFTETSLVRSILDDEVATASRVRSVPLGRAATPSDVEGMYVFLASDESAYCTGGMFTVDGGMTAC